MTKLLLATSNQGKIREFTGLLSGLQIQVVGLNEFRVDEVEETGTTFEQNARLKALGYARQTGLIAIADDSGLEVNALNGRPGVLSARYGGSEMPFDRKLELLLQEIQQSGCVDRSARFVSAAAIADATGEILLTTEGTCEGSIARDPRGSRGFGYDPIFIPNGYTETFGELADEVKAQISHRARSFREIIPFLRQFKAI